MEGGDPPLRPVDRLERLWTAVLAVDPGRPETAKWVAFGRRMTVSLCALIAALGAGLTGASCFQLSRVLQDDLADRGRAVADAVARAAFVPLSLEDRGALRELARRYEGQRDLAALWVSDPSGALREGFERPTRRGLDIAVPVRAPAGGVPVGRVALRMSTASVSRQLLRLVLTSVAFNGLLVVFVVLAGLAVVRSLTVRLKDLVDEARWAAELARSNKELEEFAYVASHDLQSPLRKIAGFSQLLAERYEGRFDATADDYLRRIVDGAIRMQRLIQDLLAYSRAGSSQLKPKRTELNALLRQVLSDLEAPIKESRAEVTWDPLPALTVDAQQMGQVLQNLIANAVKFHGPEAPKVHLSARPAGKAWEFTVKDNGIGMDPKYKDQIFQMFRRLHGASEYPGTGIGLALTRKIVERHGGRIWVESAVGRGCEFHFTIAAAAAEREEA